MLDWLFSKKENKLEEETRKGFSAVKQDIESVGKWIKHLDGQDKQLFDLVKDLKQELSSIKEDLEGFKEAFEMNQEGEKNKQLFKKLGVYQKQTAVQDVQEAVQTAVQTGEFSDILEGLSANEKMLIFALLNSEMKLSYEDLALLLGKERATVRGQINAIKQKSEGLVMEIVEKNGKKRVFIPAEVKEKLRKYAKVRVRGDKKRQKNDQKEENNESYNENS
jgi:predicted transcriptional regulator